MPADDSTINTHSTARLIRDLFNNRGESLYGGEGVTQLEHALQAAWRAEQEQASPALVLAALLHDIGHVLHDLPDNAPDEGIDDVHEDLGAEWLASRYPDEVVYPVKMHVDSKRYLCATEPGYWDSLSEPSKTSLELQGGPLSENECREFEQSPHFEAAIQLRRYDDKAKIVGLETPSIDHFLRYASELAFAPHS